MSSSNLRETPLVENEEYRRLMDYKDDLVFQMSRAKIKLANFCEELYKAVVISNEVKNIFSFQDKDRLNKTRARYLLNHVCERVKRDVTVFHRFVKVLARYGGSAYLVSRHLSAELGVLERSKRRECQSSDGLGSIKPMLDIILSEDDIRILMETLVEVSIRWEEIGISLGLPRYLIDRCRGSSSAVRLSNVLCKWMSNCPREDITLQNLKHALCSQVVGMNNFALTMEKRFREAKGTNTHAAEKGGPDIQTSDEAGVSMPLVDAKEFDEVYLSEDDISILMELLAECAYKWNQIGTSLGLPISVMKELEVKSLTSETDVLYLRDILLEWLTGKHPIARDTTLSNLKLTLRSQLVCLRVTAYHLEERFRHSKNDYIFSMPLMPAAKRQHLDSTLEIKFHPTSTEVADGKSTFLDVLVSPSLSVSYQWMKDGHLLTDSGAYSGVYSDTLCIFPASQTTEGKYACRVNKGSKEVTSSLVVLTVKFPPEKSTLIGVYSRNREVPQDSWPPICTKTFINVALVNRNKDYTDSYNYSVQGDVVDILAKKELVEYEEVFGQYENGALVLVEGPPGCGKTTLMHKAAWGWAKGGKMLKGANLVYHVDLQNHVDEKFEHLSDLLNIFYRDQKECELLQHKMVRSQGEGVCFLIDGLDMYAPQEESTSVIFELILKTYLPAAMVIVASRPVATSTLRREAPVTRRIEVLGFNQQQVFEYIDKYPFSSRRSGRKISVPDLKAYLISHLNILHVCYLPVHISMVCFLYSHRSYAVPHSEKEMFEHLIVCTVLRKIRESSSWNGRSDSLEEIEGEEGNHFRKICQLAFNMTTQSQEVVQQCDTDVLLSCDTGPNDAPSLGLVTIDSTAGLYGLDQTFTFVHRTFQEYLAAFYLATLGERQQMEMIRVYVDCDQMQMVWRFYCGMVMFEEKLDQIKLIMRSASSLFRVQCALESQQSVVCDSVLEFGESRALDLTRSSLTRADLAAVAYVISNTSHIVKELAIKWCDLRDDHVRAFLSEISNNKLGYLQVLDLSYNSIGADGVAALTDKLKLCVDLHGLSLSGNAIGADGAAALAIGLKRCFNLQTLALADNNIGGNGAVALAKGLRSCNYLQALDLSDNNIDSNGVAAIAEGLKNCNNLQTLDLSHNDIGHDGEAALADLKSRTCVFHD